ncbi:unnamed protein product [Nezara viridula]|uniref:Uncharacterized protein n=1 Tax=Nezara viridula TaxID=85310 RepID=A0A9P0MPS0_NEZVI|nr:unnamed protein product [Nezara viridula]
MANNKTHPASMKTVLEPLMRSVYREGPISIGITTIIPNNITRTSRIHKNKDTRLGLHGKILCDLVKGKEMTSPNLRMITRAGQRAISCQRAVKIGPDIDCWIQGDPQLG